MMTARLDQLTGLRFVAALAVLGSHLTFLGDAPSPLARDTFALVLRQGYGGVSFFFVLSGFILSHVYRDALATGVLSPGRYLYRRAVRIVPLHWMTAAAVAIALVVRHEAPAGATVAANLMLLHGWVADPLVHYSLNGPSWSLSAELFFYAAFPLLMLVPARLLAIGTAAAAAGVTIAAARVGAGAFDPVVEWMFYVNPAVRLVDFAIGCVLYGMWRGRTVGTGAELLVLVAGVATALLVAVLPLGPLRYQVAWWPVAIAAVWVFAGGGGAVSRVLASPVAVLLGDASFALYLTHRPVVLFVTERWGGASSWGLAAALTVACVVLSMMVHVLVERPVTRWLRMVEPARRVARVAAH